MAEPDDNSDNNVLMVMTEGKKNENAWVKQVNEVIVMMEIKIRENSGVE